MNEQVIVRLWATTTSGRCNRTGFYCIALITVLTTLLCPLTALGGYYHNYNYITMSS